MAELLGAAAVVAQLQSRMRQAVKDFAATAAVGYSAPYALFVHEDMEKKHAEGQAKFLTQPAKAHARELGLMVRMDLQAGKPLGQALLRMARQLMDYSVKLVPVATGALKASAFVRLEGTPGKTLQPVPEFLPNAATVALESLAPRRE
jgi:hypothetical protein